MSQSARTVVHVDGRRLHRFQVVLGRHGSGDGRGDERDVETWIVVGFDDGEVHLADVGFERTHSVPVEAFRTGRFEPLAAGDVPIWGY